MDLQTLLLQKWTGNVRPLQIQDDPLCLRAPLNNFLDDDFFRGRVTRDDLCDLKGTFVRNARHDRALSSVLRDADIQGGLMFAKGDICALRRNPEGRFIVIQYTHCAASAVPADNVQTTWDDVFLFRREPSRPSGQQSQTGSGSAMMSPARQ